MSNIELYEILLMVFIPMAFVGISIPFIKKIAFHINAIDIPNERKIHKKPMPRLGGLGIFFGFLLGYMIFGNHTYLMNSILIGSFVLLITGIIDDINPLKAKEKLIGQIIASVIEWAMFCSGVYAKSSIRLTAVKAATTDTPIVLTII